MSVLYNTNFLVGLNNQVYDLGNILYNYSSNTVQISAAGTTLAMASIDYDRPTIILETDITATMDGTPFNGDQVLTFGPAVQNRTVIIGQNQNGAAFSNDGININPLGVTNVVSNTGSAVFWDGVKWFGIILRAAGSNANTALSYDGIYWIYLTTIGFFINAFVWKALYNGEKYVMAGGGGSTTTVGYSFDGINWTAGIGTASSAIFYALAYNGVAWLLGGSTSPYLYYSLDGITWTAATHSFTTVQDAVWMGDKWVVCGIVGTFRVAFTFDRTGATGWTTANSSTIFGTNATRLSWNGKILVIQSNGTNTLGYSYNGIIWVGIGLTIFPSIQWGYLSWNGKSFLAGGSNAGNGLAYSYNGVNWVGLGTSFVGSPYNITHNSRRQHTITYQRNLTVVVGSGTSGAAYSYDGITWTNFTNTSIGQGGGIAYNGRVWVSGTNSTGNSLSVSTDGFSWTPIGGSASLLKVGPQRMTWNGSIFVAVCADNTAGNCIAYSYEGMTWMPSFQSNSIFFGGAWSVSSNSSMIIAVGQNNAGVGNTIAYSTNGYNWIGLGATGITQWGFDIANNGSMWVAVGSLGQIAYSYDGITWRGTGSTLFASNVRGVAWNGTMWVAVGQSPFVAYSYDGIVWRAGTGTGLFTTAGYGVSWNGTVWVAAGLGPNSLMYSFNGINWVGITLKTRLSSFGYGVASNYQVPPKAFIQHPTLAFGASSGGRGNTIAYSPDGINWTGLGNTVFSTQARRAFWSGKIWIAGGQGGNTLAYSYDGFKWTGLGSSTFTTVCNSVCYNGSIWVATGQGTNTIAYSTNGFTWTGVSNSTQIFTTEGYGVAWNGNTFLATGTGSNTIATSTNGITWSGSTSFPFNAVNGGRHPGTNGFLWVVPYGSLSGNGLAYSFDVTGRTGWATTTGIFTGGARSVTWNGRIWVATGAGSPGGIVYSYNGINWTLITGDPLNNATPDVCWNGTRFVAYGSSASYSPNGITWYGNSFNSPIINPPRVFSGDGFLASNSGVGAFAPPSAMVLNQYGVSGNGIASSQILEIVSSDSYYQTGFTNMSVKVECNNIYQ